MRQEARKCVKPTAKDTVMEGSQVSDTEKLSKWNNVSRLLILRLLADVLSQVL